MFIFNSMEDEKIIVAELKRLGHTIKYKDEYRIAFETPDSIEVIIEYDYDLGLYNMTGGITDMCESTSDLLLSIRHEGNWSKMAKENSKLIPQNN